MDEVKPEMKQAAVRHKKNGGQNCQCTPAVIKAVAQKIEDGLFFEDACSLTGICRKSAYRWMKQAKEAGDTCNPLFVRFLLAVEESRAKFKDFLIGLIKSGVPQWQSRAWLLERIFPAQYGSDKETLSRLKRFLAEEERKQKM